MDMATDYSHLLAEYPEKICHDQFYRICRISKRKATWLLENGYIPCEDTGKKTRRFKIRITDVVEYLTRLEDSQIDAGKFMEMLKKKWRSFPDALTVGDVIKMTGYSQTAVSQWISKEKLFGVWYYNKYLIPKDCLIEYMATKAHRITQKSKKHMDLIQQYQVGQTPTECRKTS